MKCRWLGLIALAMSVAGCASSGPKQADPIALTQEMTRSFKAEDEARVLEAAQIVLKQSDPGDWQFRLFRDGLEGRRRYFATAIIVSRIGAEYWDLRVDRTTPGTIRVELKVSDRPRTYNAYGPPSGEYRLKSPALYRLFWARVDFVLGKRPDWISCQQAIAEGGQGVSPLGGLCGVTSDGRDAPPPERLAKRPKSNPAAMLPPAGPSTDAVGGRSE